MEQEINADRLKDELNRIAHQLSLGESGRLRRFLSAIGRSPERCYEEVLLSVAEQAIGKGQVTAGSVAPRPTLRGTDEPYTTMVLLHAVARRLGLQVDIVDRINGGDGISKGGKIEVLFGLTPQVTLAVLAHELAHELIHQEAPRGKFSREFEEFEAECVSFAISVSAGIEAELLAEEQFLNCHGGEPALLASSLNRIQCAVSKLAHEMGVVASLER